MADQESKICESCVQKTGEIAHLGVVVSSMEAELRRQERLLGAPGLRYAYRVLCVRFDDWKRARKLKFRQQQLASAVEGVPSYGDRGKLQARLVASAICVIVAGAYLFRHLSWH